MDKRKSDAASALQRKKKVKANEVHGRIPITAFFERIPPRPRPEGTPPAAHDHIEEIDEDVISTERTTNTAPSTSHMIQETLKFEQNEKTVPKRTFTGFHMLRGRELRGGLSLRHRQHVLRSVVKSYAPLGVAPLPDIQPSQWISCMQFDTDGVLLATGSSDGTIALYDFDEYFHRMLVFCNQRTNMEAPTTTDNISISLSSTCPNAGAPSCIKPVRHAIHVLHTRRELKRVRWNPMDQDMLACSFTSRNEIFLFNLKKFPAEPYRILKAPTRPSTGYYDFLFTTSSTYYYYYYYY
ncbi:hypothetical protein AaE_008199 [Aphanomyces astaci]|uniref:Uncharacterized protein n=1 Tax=Aphanomyces astaci TaxID=112090 RepID=A0A6A5AFI9_APHAT|nr:hypothetical protein AaE_008199 [Aphanomyces astaci]